MAAKRAKPSSKNAARGCKAGNVWLSSLYQRAHSQNLRLQQQRPQWVQRHQSCLPSPRRQKGRSCSFKSRLGASAKSLTTINGTSQSMSTGRNDRPPTRKGNHPFMGAPYRACQRHEPPQSVRILSWDFLVLWMRSGQPHQNHVWAARGISEPHATIRVPERSRPAEATHSARLGLLRPAACLRLLDLLLRPLHLPFRLLHLLLRLLHRLLGA